MNEWGEATTPFGGVILYQWNGNVVTHHWWDKALRQVRDANHDVDHIARKLSPELRWGGAQ
jgi:hypothetical protein